MKCKAAHHLDAGGGRPPCGGRGLKYGDPKLRVCADGSPPLRGAWIEIRIPRIVDCSVYVAPLAGGVD